MVPSRRSERSPKPKKHFKSEAYPPRKSRIKGAALNPQTVLQPVSAEGTLSSHTIDTPLEFPKFIPLPINEHRVLIRVLGGIRDAFKLFSLFFSPEFLNVL